MSNGGTVSCFAGSDGDFVQMFENGTNSNYHEAGHQFSGKLQFSVIGSSYCLVLSFFFASVVKTEQSAFALI